MEAKDVPQILELTSQQVGHTIYGVRWVPASPKFVAFGAKPKLTGSLRVSELDGREAELKGEAEKERAIRCGTFGASSLAERHFATGDFGGYLQMWDLEALRQPPAWEVKAHESIVNCVDGCGDTSTGGAPELATGGRDGCVRVWDVRQKDAPVAVFKPGEGVEARDCWAVAFGNAHENDERCVAAGYDNGDVKLFDLRAGKARWEKNVGNGVCGLEFDRKSIRMNKLAVSCLESQLHFFDMRTQHPSKGFCSTTETAPGDATVWNTRFLPQNREVSAVLGGPGSIFLYRYHYPDQRKVTASDGKSMGVPGSLERLTERKVAEQPVADLDWSPDKLGLAACASFDQHVRILAVTKLERL